MTSDDIPRFLKCFDQDFYVSESAVQEAVRRKSCFNLIHLPTSFKIDVFVSEGRPFDRIRMQRATREEVGTGNTLSVTMTSAKDSVISKLEWYRKGNETSERQRDDVSRPERLLCNSADVAYLKEAAESVGVKDLLSRLLSES